jgi:hypothetical protein
VSGATTLFCRSAKVYLCAKEHAKLTGRQQCPLYPRQRISGDAKTVSTKDHKRTSRSPLDEAVACKNLSV